MTVYFIGAGPGAADLLTLRADRLIRSCPVCLYAGSIVPPGVLGNCSESAETINTARMPLGTIIETIQAAYAAGKDVVRPQSGDLSVWLALAGQVRRLGEPGIDYEIVPGVPAFSAAAAALGHKLTMSAVGQSVVLTHISGHASKIPEGETLENSGRTGAILCVYLAAHDIDRMAEELTPHYGEYGPIAVVAFASRPEQVIPRGTLSDIAQQVKDAGVTRMAVIIVGKVFTAEAFPDSYLYSDDRPRDEHGRTIPCVH